MTPREAIIRTLQRVPDQYSSMTSHEKSTMICWPDGRILFCVEGPSPDGRGLQATEPHEGITVYGFRDHDGFCAVIGERYYAVVEVAAIVGEGEP